MTESSNFSVGAVLARLLRAFTAAGVAAVAGWLLLHWWRGSFGESDTPVETARAFNGAGTAPSFEEEIDDLSDAQKRQLLDELGSQL